MKNIIKQLKSLGIAEVCFAASVSCFEFCDRRGRTVAEVYVSGENVENINYYPDEWGEKGRDLLINFCILANEKTENWEKFFHEETPARKLVEKEKEKIKHIENVIGEMRGEARHA